MYKTYQRTRRWLFIATTVAVVCFAPYMIIFGANNANASLGNLQSSTANQGIANAMAQCMNFAYDRMEELSAGSEYSQGDLFNSPEGYNPFAGVGDIYINVGYSTGQAITGYLNSTISCNITDPLNPSASVIDKFAQSVGKTDYMDIVCNGESAGIMKQQYWNGSNWVDSVGQCRTTPASGTQYRYVWNDERAANSYLNSLYSGDWYSVSDFTPEQNYYRYYDEYIATCVDPKDTTPVNVNAPNIDHSKYGSTIYWYDNNGSLTEIHFKEKDNTKSWGISGLSSGLGGASSCGELAQLINNQHEAMDDFVLAEKEEAKKSSCVNSIPSDKLNALKGEAQGIVTLNRHSPNTVPAEVVKNANRVLRNEFWEKDSNGDIVCWIPDSLSSGSSTTTTPPPTTPDPDENEPSASGGNNNANSSNGATNGTSSDLAECFNNASSLGWILCPVLKFVGVAADGLWQEVSENWLVVDADDYKAEGEGIYKAWTYFRNFANIAFVILLTFIIISQLTGYGITNYGIKKMLPNLIVMAVLINISFFICQALIDVSNIVGISIEGILDGIRNAIAPSSTIGGGDVFRGVLATLFNAVGIAGIGVGVYVAVQLNGVMALMVPLLISMLGAIIGIVFAFLILAIRQAGILITVILSPLAIICYSLPNAKSLFDKWKKLFTSLLFVYPICSVCIYGGQLVSSLMLSNNNTGFMYNLVGMLLQIVPIFFIPSLIKSSLAAAGNIGAKVSQFGSGLRGRATKALYNSEAVERARTTSQYKAAQRNRNFFEGLSKRGGRLGKVYKAIGDYGQRRADKAAANYNKMRLGEHQARLTGLSISDDSIQRSLDSLDIKDMERRVAEDVDSLIKDDAFDTTDPKTINSAFEAALKAVDADPTNEEKMIRAKSLMSLLMGKGDTGQSLMNETLASHVNSTTGVGNAGSQAMRALGAYASYNDKWMGSIKNGDTGAYKFLNDLASGQSIQSAGAYAAAGASKVTQSSIGGMGDSWYRSIDKSLGNGTLSEDAIRKYADMATKALTDPRYAGSIKGERLDTLNNIRQAAYDLDKKDKIAAGMSEAEYENQYGTFQKLENPGDTLWVPRQAAKVPTGWNEDGTWNAQAMGRQATKQDKIAYEEWARHKAEVDRHNSQK